MTRCPKCDRDNPKEIAGSAGDGLLQINITCTCGERFEIFEKTCKCCRKTYNRAEWSALKLVGITDGVEMRNCPCGSTLAIEVL